MDIWEQAVEVYEAHGRNATHAADAIGVPRSTLNSRLKKAARIGLAPGHFNNGAAPGFAIGKVTIQRNADGVVERTWERQSPEQEDLQAWMEATANSLKTEIVYAAPIASPKVTLKHLCTLYTFTDYHLGMLAWHKEGGADWDLGIAQTLGIAAMQSLVGQAPQSDTAIVNIQGDFLHADGLVPETPTSKHVLDADSRFGKVADVALVLIRQLVAMALGKHRNVVLVIAEGNHDLNSSMWLRKLFGMHYENEPRVEVVQSEIPYYAFEWGNTLIGFHHGHLKKNDQLPTLFAAQFRAQWGRCPKVYIHTGHRHHKEDKEHTGARVIQHTTLAPRDAYAARGGWWSERALTAYTYHKEFGEAGSITVTPEQLQ